MKCVVFVFITLRMWRSHCSFFPESRLLSADAFFSLKSSAQVFLDKLGFPFKRIFCTRYGQSPTDASMKSWAWIIVGYQNVWCHRDTLHSVCVYRIHILTYPLCGCRTGTFLLTERRWNPSIIYIPRIQSLRSSLNPTSNVRNGDRCYRKLQSTKTVIDFVIEINDISEVFFLEV